MTSRECRSRRPAGRFVRGSGHGGGHEPVREDAVTTTTATAAEVDATRFVTSSWTLPSSDPSGITFVPGGGLLISDAEVEEPLPHTRGASRRTCSTRRWRGEQRRPTTVRTVGWSNEPTGVSYVAAAGNPWNGHLFVTDDDQKGSTRSPRPGGRRWDRDDGSGRSSSPSAFGNTDPEDVAFDSTHNELWIAGGLSTIVSRVNPGADNIFATAGDNVTKNFELPDSIPTRSSHRVPRGWPSTPSAAPSTSWTARPR